MNARIFTLCACLATAFTAHTASATTAACVGSIENDRSGLPVNVLTLMKHDKVSAQSAIAKLRSTHPEQGRGDFTISPADLSTQIQYFNPLKKQCVTTPLSKTAYGKELARQFAYMKQNGTHLVTFPTGSAGSWLTSTSPSEKIQSWNGFSVALRAYSFDLWAMGGYRDLIARLETLLGRHGLGDKSMSDVLSISSSDPKRSLNVTALKKTLQDEYDF